MRDIKFRFWNKSTGTMSIPYTLEEIRRFRPWSFVGYEDMEIMQYTGLKDKNGAVGKIVWKDVPFHNSGYTTVGYIIESVQGVKVPTYASSDIHFYEVIGNIYQNPELLNDKNV